jgi:hypothetical protein
MSPSSSPTTPRDGLDAGSLAELCSDSSEVQLDVRLARPWPEEHRDIAVPDDASALIEGLGGYGS